MQVKGVLIAFLHNYENKHQCIFTQTFRKLTVLYFAYSHEILENMNNIKTSINQL